MLTVHLEAQVSPEQLLKALDQLSAADLERFFVHLLALRAQRKAPALRPEESELLLKINQGLPPDLRDRYEVLGDRRRSEALTPDEHHELLELTDRVEALEAERAANLARLAQLRGVPLAALLDSLGIHAAE
jgi:hypothetical protein